MTLSLTPTPQRLVQKTLATGSLAVPSRVRSFVRHCLRRLEDEACSLDDALGTVMLLPHQVSGAARLRAILLRHGGALLADEVGLGKTYTALAVARGTAPVLVVAPASVREMWRTAGERCAVPITVVSYEQLSAGRLPPAARWTLVILDEAHRARTPATRRYGAIAQLAVGAQLLLLTATPVHNRRADLDALLALFLGSGATSLDAATLGALIVRRRVDDVGTHLPALGAVQRHALPHAPGVLDAIRTLPPPLPPADGGVAASLVALQLARAWCSSDAALLAAIRRRLATAIAIEHALAAGRLPTHRDLASWTAAADGSVQLAFPELVAPAAPSSDVAALLSVVRWHAEALRAVRTLVRTHAARDGARLNTLQRILDAHRDRQVVVFTHSAETAESVFRALRDHTRVALLTGRGACIASGPIPRAELLAAFAPDGIHRRTPDDVARIDVLVASDVVSEGVNLHAAAVIVHLDLPWTVARFEQRMGRVRRIGSAHHAIESHLILPPADAEELGSTVRLLARKAQLASGAVGASSILLGAEAWTQQAAADDECTPVAGRRALVDRLRAIDQAAAEGAASTPPDATRHAPAPLNPWDASRGGHPIRVPGLDAPRALALVRVAHDARLVVGSDAGASDALSAVLAVLDRLSAAWAPCARHNHAPSQHVAPAPAPAHAPAPSPAPERAIHDWCAHENARRQLHGDVAHDSEAHRRLMRALATAVARAPRTRRAHIAARAATARTLASSHTGAGADRMLDELCASAPFAASLGATLRGARSVVAPATPPPPLETGKNRQRTIATAVGSAQDEGWLEHVLRRLSETPTRPAHITSALHPGPAGRDMGAAAQAPLAPVTIEAMITLEPDIPAP